MHPPATTVKKLLDERGIPFTEKTVNSNVRHRVNA